VTAFIALHLALIVSWSVPIRSLSGIKRLLAPYASASGLFQSWDMFAPDPPHGNGYLDAEIIYRNGQIQPWHFPQMQELSYVDRYFQERYRKWANERLSDNGNSALWPDAARYIARLNSNDANPPQVVRLVRYWSALPAPDEPPQREHWERSVFFSYVIRPGDLP
jgi:hypothetical protein